MNQVRRQNRDLAREQKTLRQAQSMAFTTQLFYFSMKILFCFILYKYKNSLDHQIVLIVAFGLLLIVNGYMILSTGKNPGFQASISQCPNPSISHELEGQQNGLVEAVSPSPNYCTICNCYKKNRTKHCYRCGKCVRKFDHHCPWIGACVGESNHCRFCLMTLLQSVQALFSFWICFNSMRMYEYKEDKQSYSQEFGVFAIFALFMFFYVIFVFSLFVFHAYLIICNYTTTQLTRRSKADYLKGTKGNPFDEGICKNIMQAIKVPDQGHNWNFDKCAQNRRKGWLSYIFSNQYYQCC